MAFLYTHSRRRLSQCFINMVLYLGVLSEDRCVICGNNFIKRVIKSAVQSRLQLQHKFQTGFDILLEMLADDI